VDWIRFDDLERSYGARLIFDGVSGALSDSAKVGLVGANGAGKSSLVRILAGFDAPDAGRVIFAREARLGYLDQKASADDAETLGEIVDRAFAHIFELEDHVRALEEKLADPAVAEDAELLERTLNEYGDAREAYERHSSADADRRTGEVLATFGFAQEDLGRPARSFSGGQRTRAALARTFLEDPDYFILDEPTNHLDLETVTQLEDFLIADPRAALIVSHDRSFLDRVATEIWDLSNGKLERYVVPRGRAYAAYVEEKQQRRELALLQFAKFKEEERRRKAVVAELKTHGSHNYSAVRSREKQLAKLEVVEEPPPEGTQIFVKLEAARRATNGRAICAKDLRVAYAQPLFDKLSFDIVRGERMAIVGPNGAGKSTLLNVLSGKKQPDFGSVEVMHGVKTAYFSQESADDLAPGSTAVAAVQDGAPVTDEIARNLLGRMGLTGDAGDKPVEAFSGGERRRIMLARLMAKSADVLFLDEPTNDLDIPSREALEAVLDSYGGAMVVVSHDRYLLRRLCEKVMVIQDGHAKVIEGGYERFEKLRERVETAAIATKASKAAKAAAAPAPKAINSAQLERDARQRRDKAARELATSEREAAKRDEELRLLEAAFADPAIYDDRKRLAELQAQLESARAAAEAAFAKWESLSSVQA
jgi:ATP-binding cassette subfamily F protein 3